MGLDIHYLKMRIGIDLRPFLREETGVGIYLKHLLFHLARIDSANEYFLFSASWKDRFPVDKVPPFARMIFRDERIPLKALNFFWYRWPWPHVDLFFRTTLHLTHSPTPLPLPTKGKKIVTVHDLFFLDFPEQAGREAGEVFFRRTAQALRRADGIITFSSFTRDEIITRFEGAEGKVKVIPHGLAELYEEDIPSSELEETRRKYHLPSSFLLFVGAQEPRKNLVRLLEALKVVHLQGRKIPLVMVGPAGLDTEGLLAKAEKLELSSWLVWTGYLAEKEVRQVYRLATAFVFPSLCEGFGLPLLEAMASGLPVVASFASAIPEVCQDAAIYFRPEDTEQMAEKIIAVLEDSRAREDLIARGRKRVKAFRWEKAAEETLRFYLSFADG